ncbi:hypothetical protein X797_006761 [Metarhizium robertsii]|uniref:Uncharacterized protein n=1 Tax=Metarhizium robertsii TaxID=568076 RepID=A0A014PQI2_9HYPO|nr:hypothetical protein X797_006761 [Metarhizium robertsii]
MEALGLCLDPSLCRRRCSKRSELGDEHIPGYPWGWSSRSASSSSSWSWPFSARRHTLIFAIRTAAVTNGLGLFAIIWLALSVQLLGRPLFGLTTFSLSAAWAGLIFAAGTVRRSLRSSYGFCDNYKVFGGVVAGIARLGAIELYVSLLFFIAWVTGAVVSYRHRRSGCRARARRVAAAGSGTAPYQLQMQPRTKTDYHAVSQQVSP